MSAPQTRCPNCGGVLQPAPGSPGVLQCGSCGALTPRRSKSNAGKIIVTILGVFVVAIAIVFAGCAMLLSNVAP